jgi:hypothetical protein
MCPPPGGDGELPPLPGDPGDLPPIGDLPPLPEMPDDGEGFWNPDSFPMPEFGASLEDLLKALEQLSGLYS